jgi:hypothetical protein
LCERIRHCPLHVLGPGCVGTLSDGTVALVEAWRLAAQPFDLGTEGREYPLRSKPLLVHLGQMFDAQGVLSINQSRKPHIHLCIALT